MPTAPALLPLDYASLELLPLGVVVVDDHGRILYYNRREEEISGRRRKDVVGRNFFREVAPCPEVQAFPGRGQVRVRTLLEGRTAVVEVIDTGTGMDLEVQRRLFTPMFTTKSWGTGLGLASAHAAIRQHGGTISVSSQPGRGSHFRITLPAAPGEP